MQLSPAQLESAAGQYLDQGYAVFPGLVAAPRLQELKSAAAQIVEAFDIDSHRTIFSTRDRDRGRDDYFMDSAEKVHCFLEEEAIDEQGNLRVEKHRAINKIGHALHDQIPAFGRFAREPVFAAILAAIGYRQPELWQTMYIYKQPGIGGEVRWHQDASYLISEPSSVVGFWIALEDASRDNGCLWVDPRGHRGPLREIYRVRDGQSNGELSILDRTPWPSQGDGLAVEVPAGSLVIFHDHMPHYSSENRSPRSRQAFTMHFKEATSKWSAENWLQRPHLGPFVL